MAKLGKAMLLVPLIILFLRIPAVNAGDERTVEREAVLKELISLWRKSGGWYPPREQPAIVRTQDRKIQTAVRNIVGGLKTLGLLPAKSISLPRLGKSLDSNRLSGFLYNISMYLQGASAEWEDRPQFSDRDQFWEKLLYSLLQPEGGSTLGQWDGKIPPRPSFSLQDFFLSLRGSPHWDGLLGLVQTILSISERQPPRSFRDFLSQNWKTVSALLETVLQALISGTYGQASAGVQGFICVLKGRSDCAFNTGWLRQLMSFLETQNWKPVVNFHSAGVNRDQQGGSPSFGRLKPFSMLPGALKEENLLTNQTQHDTEDLDTMQSFLLQALSRSTTGERVGQAAEPNPALVQGLDTLRRGLLHRLGSSVYGNLRRKVSRVTVALLDDVSSLVDKPQGGHQGKCSVGDLRQLILWGIRHNLTWNAQALGFNSQGPPSRPPFMSCSSSGDEGRASRPRPPARKPKSLLPHVLIGEDGDQTEAGYPASAEILEAACNDSIPGLTGVSNFTVFLYCNLFDGHGGALDSELVHVGPDLHATCSDAAWYLSAAEKDFLWVHVCSEFFAQEFNNTVCANSSFWLQQAHKAARQKDYHYINQSSIDDLCVQISSEAPGGTGPDASEDCLAQLGTRSLSAQGFRRCFLPSNTVLITSLCGNESAPLPQEGSWVAEYCSKVLHNSSHVHLSAEACNYNNWTPESFTNSTLLKFCGGREGLQNRICRNVTLYLQLVVTHHWLLDFCTDLGSKPDDTKCFLQRVFDMLPAPYDFDTSQLCVNPAPFLLEALYRLSQCEGAVDERVGWLGTVSYVLRVLDFVVGLSAGLEEGESEVRQGLGQAILLSSLLDNTSFWATLRPNASLSVLQTVAVFLKKEQNPSLKEDLLSCFSPVLWDLIQKDDNSSALKVLLQEYLQMPRESIRTMLMSAEKDAVKRFLSHMHQSWDQLQVDSTQASQKEQQAMETMTSAFIHKFPRVTPDLFIDLSQFIPFMSVSDIMSFPASLMVNDSVLMAIRDHSSGMKSQQKQAFVKRLLQSHVLGEVPSWPPYFLSSILPLLPHLPVYHFQQLTSQQLSPLVEALGNSSLDGIRGRHVLRAVFSKKNLTSDDFLRLGVLGCYLNPEDLHLLLLTSPLSQPLWQRLALCVSEGLISPSGRLSHWLLQALKPLNASALSSPALTSLRGLLPLLGASFLEPFPSPQVLDLLSQPGMPRYPPAQAFQILSSLTQHTNLSMDTLCKLKPLLPGLSLIALRTLTWPEPGEASLCQCWRPMLVDLQPAHRAMLYATLQQALDHTLSNSSLQLRCVLPFIPLRRLASEIDGATVLRDLPLYKHLPWSPQQAQLLFKKILQAENITKETAATLGNIAGGMSCDWLRLWANESHFSELVQFISELPGEIRPALRKCVTEELLRRPETDMNVLSPSFSARLPVKMIENLSNISLVAVLDYIQQNFDSFLRLPRHKQTVLAEQALSVLGVALEDSISGAALDLLGPLLPFLDRDTFGRVNREALRLRLEDLKGYCLPQDVLTEVAKVLTDRGLFGEPSSWTVGEVEHAGRLVFALSPRQITSLPLGVLSTETVEQVLEAERSWEDSEVGGACGSPQEHRDKRESLLQGIVKGKGGRRKGPTPSCADIKGTYPSAWRAAQLGRMGEAELGRCVEALGRDSSLGPEQRRTLWTKLRRSYGPVKAMRPDQLLELGCIVTEMNERELQETNLTDLGTVAHLGSLTGWSPKKMRAAVLSFLRRGRRKVGELGVAELASLGNLLCGLTSYEIKRLDPYNLSLAVLFLRELALPCTEQQTEALTYQLSSPLGFGPISNWGSEVFTEIGTLAVGLPDMVLSALVREQIEGLTPAAITLIPPSKLAVVFSESQLSWLSQEQASAVTRDQWAELGSEQRQALVHALYEGVIQEYRGRNWATPAWSIDSLSVCILHLCCLLCHLL
ncbi:stereocilin [Anguilla anguilla]|uniref:stereocilin n=1 Tax=Anguilla anguilla TaxID=7936 RepID=UPI0015B0EF9C|nr:stereocilin [Anguilla anguilla]